MENVCSPIISTERYGKFALINLVALSSFVVNPFMSVLITFHLIYFEETNRTNLYILFAILALFLGLINSTKILDSDLVNYYDQFKEAGESPFINYIFSQGKEPAFYMMNYITYIITMGNFRIYVIIITFISYYLLFISILKYNESIGFDKKQIIFAVTIAAFFPQMFSLSAHLIRQFLAASLMMFYIVNKMVYKKNYWYLLLLAIFTHTTMAIFLPLLYLPFLRKKINLKHVIIIIIAAEIVSFVNINKIASLIIESPIFPLFISYGFNRAFAELTPQVTILPTMAWVLMGVMLCVSIYSIYKRKILNEGYVHFLNTYIFLALFILMNINYSLIFMRFFFLIYFFIPFIISLLFTKDRYIWRISKYPLITILGGVFIYNLTNGTWIYAPVREILSNTLWHFIL